MISQERKTRFQNIQSRADQVLGFELLYGLTSDDLEEMEALSGAGTREVIEKARKLTKRKLVESQIFILLSEAAAGGMIRLLHPDNFTEERKSVLLWAPVFWAANWLLRIASVAPINELQRRQEVALTAFLSQVGRDNSSEEMKTLLSATSSQIYGLSQSVRTKPQWQSAFFMIAHQINLVTLIPELMPAIVAITAIGIAQIYSAARIFRKAQGEFVRQVRETVFRLVKHGTLIDEEKQRLEFSLKRAARIPQIINLLTYVAPGLAAMLALVRGQLSEFATSTTLAAYSQGLLSGKSVETAMVTAVPSQMAIGNGIVGREALHEIMRLLRSSRLLVRNNEQYQQVREQNKINTAEVVCPRTSDTYLVTQHLEPRRLDGVNMFSVPHNMMINVGSKDRGYLLTAIEGKSGGGKSSLMHKLAQDSIQGHGAVGLVSRDTLLDFSEYGTLAEKRDRVWSNLALDESNYWMDQAYTTDELFKILSTHGLSHEHPACFPYFLRASWQEKRVQARSSEQLNEAVQILEQHAILYLQSTGLFGSHEDVSSILSKPINQNSLGQRTRIGLSFAGLKPRDIYYIDEPLQGLEFVDDEGSIEHAAATRVCVYIATLLKHAPVVLNDKHLAFIAEHIGAEKFGAVLTLTTHGIQTSTSYADKVVIRTGNDELLPHYDTSHLRDIQEEIDPLFSGTTTYTPGWNLHDVSYPQLDKRDAAELHKRTQKITETLSTLLSSVFQSREYFTQEGFVQEVFQKVIQSKDFNKLPWMWMAYWQLEKFRYETRAKAGMNLISFWYTLEPMFEQVMQVSCEAISCGLFTRQNISVLDEWVYSMQCFWETEGEESEFRTVNQKLIQYRKRISDAATHIPQWIYPTFSSFQRAPADVYVPNAIHMKRLLDRFYGRNEVPSLNPQHTQVTTISERFEGRGSQHILDAVKQDERFIVSEILGEHMPVSLEYAHTYEMMQSITRDVSNIPRGKQLLVWIHDYEPHNLPNRQMLNRLNTMLSEFYGCRVQIVTRTTQIGHDNMFSIPQFVDNPIMCLGLEKLPGVEQEADRLHVPVEWIHRKIAGNQELLNTVHMCSTWDEVLPALEIKLLSMIRQSTPEAMHGTITPQITQHDLQLIKPIVRDMAHGCLYERAYKNAYPSHGKDKMNEMTGTWYSFGVLVHKSRMLAERNQTVFIPEVMAVLGS